MNRKAVFNITGRLLEALGIILLLPMLVSIIYREKSFLSFLITAGISFLVGAVIRRICRTDNNIIYAKEGFLIVALAWIATSLFGALPFFISGEIPSYIDAVFETASGFTTTGASILKNVEALSHGMLFWRSFTHWIGGMGVLVFIIAFVSNESDRTINILRAEMPGPTVGKLVPRAKDTSKVLYIIYIAITLVLIVLLLFGGMPLFDSILYAFGTAGTGGFGIKADSVAGYSTYCQWVIAVFMFIFGINFNLFHLFLIKRFKAAIKNTEFWVYFGMVVVCSALVFIDLRMYADYTSISTTVKDAFFQVTSIISTTGFTTTNFDLWPSFSKGILFILLFTGACAGSTAGGLKISRTIILFKMIGKELKIMIHPRAVATVNLDNKEVDSHMQRSVATYFAIYMICIFLIFLALALLEPFDFESLLTATATAFNNVGPGFGVVGPTGGFADFTPISKVLLSLAMIMGRLEIFPILIALFPSTWKKR